MVLAVHSCEAVCVTVGGDSVDIPCRCVDHFSFRCDESLALTRLLPSNVDSRFRSSFYFFFLSPKCQMSFSAKWKLIEYLFVVGKWMQAVGQTA